MQIQRKLHEIIEGSRGLSMGQVVGLAFVALLFLACWGVLGIVDALERWKDGRKVRRWFERRKS